VTRPLAARLSPRLRPAAWVAIKTIHTFAFVVIASLVGLVAWDGLRQRPRRRTAIGAVVGLGEAIVYVSNNQVCPLAPLAEELGATSGTVTDIFLPGWVSRRVPVCSGAVLGLGLVLNLRAWLAASWQRDGGLADAEAMRRTVRIAQMRGQSALGRIRARRFDGADSAGAPVARHVRAPGRTGARCMPFLGRIARLLLVAIAVIPIVGTLWAYMVKQRIKPVHDAEANDVRLAAIFEPILYRSTATAFQGGTIDFWYGGGVVDLRNATLDPAGAHLDVRAVFGGGQLLVPDSWNVTGRVLGIGGYADNRPNADRRDAAATQLTITGVAAFGGFAVSSEISEDDSKSLEATVARFAHLRSERVEASARPVAAT
jgi:hypothetical protein